MLKLLEKCLELKMIDKDYIINYLKISDIITYKSFKEMICKYEENYFTRGDYHIEEIMRYLYKRRILEKLNLENNEERISRKNDESLDYIIRKNM